jgi:hypothetical protein
VSLAALFRGRGRRQMEVVSRVLENNQAIYAISPNNVKGTTSFNDVNPLEKAKVVTLPSSRLGITMLLYYYAAVVSA